MYTRLFWQSEASGRPDADYTSKWLTWKFQVSTNFIPIAKQKNIQKRQPIDVSVSFGDIPMFSYFFFYLGFFFYDEYLSVFKTS